MIENYTKDTSFLTKKSNYVEISYSKRRPKILQNGVFVLYTLERIKLQPGEIKIVDMKLHLKLSKNLIGGCVLLPSLISHNIKLLNACHISTDSLTLKDSPYRIVFEIQNRNMSKTIQLKAETELGFFTILNSGTTEELRHKFIKCNEL